MGTPGGPEKSYFLEILLTFPKKYRREDNHIKGKKRRIKLDPPNPPSRKIERQSESEGERERERERAERESRFPFYIYKLPINRPRGR